jgi:thioredoxin reductase (NADPH)
MRVECDVLIVGSGPAGQTAAIYTARAGLKPIVLTGMTAPGGALMNTTDIENYPGFKDGIRGAELMETIQQQSERFGAVHEMDEVETVDFSGELKIVQTQMGNEYVARAVILAPGNVYRRLGCKGENEFAGRGISYCATCDGFFFKGKDVLVAGGGDTAMEEAIYLSHITKSVTVIHRRDELRASKIMAERAMSNSKISFLLSKTISEVVGNEKTVTGVILQDAKTGETTQLPTEGVFVSIGADPTTQFLRGALELDDNGYIVVKGNTSQTSVAGVFAAGDASDPRDRQAVVAAGSGAKAAIDAERYLEESF